MMPAAFVFLDALPLTPRGKVDRQALPAVDRARPEPEEAFVPPRTPIEHRIAEIWTEVLRIEQISIHDNFFALGGHSLLVMQVISRLRNAFQVELSPHSLFELSTVAHLAEYVETLRWATQDQQAAANAIVGDREEVKL